MKLTAWFKRLLGETPSAVIVVSGLPRSGTSMMMKMLEAGGLEVITDYIREPNQDNPKGYYEFERVKKLPEGDTAWLPEAEGKAVKIISALLTHLPDAHTYKVLFMNREMQEILASQRRMLVNREEASDQMDDEEMAQLFENHLRDVYAWMEQHDNVAYMDVSYNTMLKDARPVLERVVDFLDMPLDLDAMVGVVDPSLYRQRH
jgi:hypothetical protein